jgi:putative glutamine amidotransferase
MRGLKFDLHFADYPRSVALAGGLPVELTRDADANDIVEHLDGLILSGGADVDPAHYHEEHQENLGPLEPDRDEWELALLAVARKKEIPVLAICRGMQLVNVAFGGTLRQHVDISEGVGHPQWDVDGHETTHSVSVVSGTLAATLYEGEIGVNSLHHQVVETIGENLIVSAKSPDGVVEGFETRDGSLLAVQWHPELLDAPDPSFRWIVAAAQKYHDA